MFFSDYMVFKFSIFIAGYILQQHVQLTQDFLNLPSLTGCGSVNKSEIKYKKFGINSDLNLD